MMSLLVAGAALALAVVFCGAAISGLRSHTDLVAAIAAYRVLREDDPRRVAPLMVFAESAAALLLVSPVTRQAGAVVSSLLLFSFTAAIALNVVRGTTDFDCGCGGRRPLRPGVALLARNVVLCGASLAVALVPALPLDVRQCVAAALLLCAWWLVNAMIAAAQWPSDD